jgi:hypothetical protein
MTKLTAAFASFVTAPRTAVFRRLTCRTFKTSQSTDGNEDGDFRTETCGSFVKSKLPVRSTGYVGFADPSTKRQSSG